VQVDDKGRRARGRRSRKRIADETPTGPSFTNKFDSRLRPKVGEVKIEIVSNDLVGLVVSEVDRSFLG
jgi:hypothetical protein